MHPASFTTYRLTSDSTISLNDNDDFRGLPPFSPTSLQQSPKAVPSQPRPTSKDVPPRKPGKAVCCILGIEGGGRCLLMDLPEDGTDLR